MSEAYLLFAVQIEADCCVESGTSDLNICPNRVCGPILLAGLDAIATPEVARSGDQEADRASVVSL